MGGRMSLPFPMSFPVRIALMNMSCVQLPSPVSLSGVRLRVKDVPQGPLQAVRLWLVMVSHLSGVIPRILSGYGGSFSFAGCPERRRVVSGIGPIGVITFGEWQSLHPARTTRYLPCSIMDFEALGVLG